MYSIKDYFLIGDLHTSALVSTKGSIDWMCLPHFDSESLFGRLLDRKAGTFAVDAMDFITTSRYVRDTAIVETTFKKNGEAEFQIRDFMLPLAVEKCERHYLVRKLKGISGTTTIRFFFDPKPRFALEDIVLKKVNGSLKGVVNSHTVWLHLPQGAKTEELASGFIIEIPIKSEECKQLVFEYSQNEQPNYNGQDFEPEVESFWKAWVKQGHFFEFCKDELIRSAITLKLMQFYPSGGIIAAPTTSLPETIGGARNWDYRYVWIRDATFTLYALYVLGYTEEASKFFEFIEKIVLAEEADKEFSLDLFYTIDGKRVPREKTLGHLGGYQASKPVRIGNGARDQFQLDIYGSIIDAYYFVSKRKVAISPATKRVVFHLVEMIKKRWQEKDNGIWESRAGEQQYIYSRIMAQVGINRAIRLCEPLGIKQEKRAELEALEKEITDWIWQHGYSEKTKTLRQHPNTEAQDATNFIAVLLQFLDYKDPRTKEIINNTSKELGYKELFVYRYLNEDNLDGKEGAFVLCTFWFISALAIIGEIDEAERLFYRFRGFIAASGLMSEEIDPDTYEFLGNFPQAFSHVGYIMSAFYINRYKIKHRKK
ncbi:MAG: glycoside hydrolase family 15 protein [Candidatus Doudnabacteria bacterium]|nr:glycoside hydrolase family 15 protein [Candidatus Doudnabacteria bacterium]